MSNGFDRVRPRTPRPSSPAGTSVTAGATVPDAEGKRALFSSADVEQPGIGSVTVECSRCEQETVLSLAQALRAAWPSVHLALRLGHGSDVTVLGASGRAFPSYLRCPSCKRASWVRFTVRM
jgi:hypothetical protein